MFVPLSAVDQFLRKHILNLALSGGELGVSKRTLEHYLSPNRDPDTWKLRDECPGWFLLSGVKRGNRLNRVLQHMVARQEVRLEERPANGGTWVAPLNVLDKLVAALNRADDESAKGTASDS